MNLKNRLAVSLIGFLCKKSFIFLQMFGVPFNLQFSRNLNGPYSESLRKAFISMEIGGVIHGFTSGERNANVTNGGCASADKYLSEIKADTSNLIKKLSHLIEGYESPYGLKLLSSVHWLARHENHFPVEKIIEEMSNWNENKRNSFDDISIRTAYDRLVEDRLLN